MTVTSDLATLGWRSIEDFQRGWNLGPALAVDGKAGPVTLAALALSIDRHAKGLPDLSVNFSAREFACACGGANPRCQRIWVHRALVAACETFRTKVGPLTIVRGCRCTYQNARVGGAKNSQHLYGTGADVQVYAISAATVRGMGIVSGIGTYTYSGDGKAYVRHLDVRHVWGKDDARNTTDSTIAAPATWSYGKTTTRPLALAPQRATTSPTPSEEDDMADHAAQLNRIESNAAAARQEANYAHIHAKQANAKGDANSAAIRELAAGLGPTVQAAVEAALAADYEAELTLTKKETP